MEANKFRVVIFLENLTINHTTPALHYVVGDTNIRNMCLKLFLRKMDADFDSLKEFFVEKKLVESWTKKFETATKETLEKYNATNPYEFFLAYCNKNINDTMSFIDRGGCGEGTITFQSTEMTEEEYNNPTGEIISPYSYELEEEIITPTRYSFYHPITKELTKVK